MFILSSNLSGHTHRAGVEVALSHHGAPHHYQGSRGEPDLVSPQQRRHQNIPACPHLSVSLDHHPRPEVVEGQGLVGLTQPQLPGESCVLYPSPGGGPGASVMARDEDVLRLALGHPSSYHSHTDLADKLDRDPGGRVGTLQVVDELGEVL